MENWWNVSLERDGVQLLERHTVVAGSEADQWQGKNELIIKELILWELYSWFIPKCGNVTFYVCDVDSEIRKNALLVAFSTWKSFILPQI